MIQSISNTCVLRVTKRRINKPRKAYQFLTTNLVTTSTFRRKACVFSISTLLTMSGCGGSVARVKATETTDLSRYSLRTSRPETSRSHTIQTIPPTSSTLSLRTTTTLQARDRAVAPTTVREVP